MWALWQLKVVYCWCSISSRKWLRSYLTEGTTMLNFTVHGLLNSTLNFLLKSHLIWCGIGTKLSSVHLLGKYTFSGLAVRAIWMAINIKANIVPILCIYMLCIFYYYNIQPKDIFNLNKILFNYQNPLKWYVISKIITIPVLLIEGVIWWLQINVLSIISILFHLNILILKIILQSILGGENMFNSYLSSIRSPWFPSFI